MTENEVPASPSPSAVARRLTGRAKPRVEVLQEYQDLNAKRRERILPALWPFWAPGPEEIYRWRVELSCGCIREVLTRGDNDLPAEGRWGEPGYNRCLPVGQLWCAHDDDAPAQYCDIAEWGDRREHTFAADPVEPPDYLDAQTWARIRWDQPQVSAFWTVTLACGHATEVVSDLHWNPLDGPRSVTAERQREMIAEFEQFWASDPEGQGERERAHTRRQLAAGWPRPAPEHLCNTCPHARTIVAYQGVDWLVPREKVQKEETGARPSRKQVEQRLKKAQAEMKRLQDQLAELDEQDRATE